MKQIDLILEIYKDKRTVFTLRDIALLTRESDSSRLKQRINYYVRNNSLVNIRKGIYTKEAFDPEELACRIFTPSYISLEYVLQKSGFIFQYDERMTQVSYLSRNLQAGVYELMYRKIRNEILMNTYGIIRKDNGVNIATPERALLDILYLDKDFHFDFLAGINKELVKKLLPVYNNVRLQERINKLMVL
jgi:hypothetical protein